MGYILWAFLIPPVFAGALRFRWDPLEPVLQDRWRAKVFPEGLQISQVSLTSLAQVLNLQLNLFHQSIDLQSSWIDPNRRYCPLPDLHKPLKACLRVMETGMKVLSAAAGVHISAGQTGQGLPCSWKDSPMLLPVMRWFCGLCPYIWNFLILCCLTFVSNSHLVPLEEWLLLGRPWTSKASCGSVNWDGRTWHLFDSLQLNFSSAFSCACRRRAYRYYSTCDFVTEKSRYLYIVLQLLKYHLCSPLTWSLLFAPRLQNIPVFLCVDPYMTKLVRA